jgi:hypothetical protein
MVSIYFEHEVSTGSGSDRLTVTAISIITALTRSRYRSRY